MASKTSRESPRGSMTPMIDVVFQLLIFFVVTLKQDDILSRLKAARPEGSHIPPETQVDVIDITVHKGGFLLRGTPVSAEALDRRIAKYASMSTTASVVIRCTADSPHALLVQCLDVCGKHKMTHLSIFSL